MRSNSIAKITAAYNAKKEQDPTLGLHLVNCKALDKHSIKMMVASSSPINPETLNAFVFDALKHSMFPFSASFNSIENGDGMHYASIIAYRSPFKVRYDNNRLTQVSANSYLDQEMQEVWQKTEVEGKTIFFRSNDQNIDEVTSNLLLASSLKQEIKDVPVSKNNIVEFYFLSSKGQPNKLLGSVEELSEDLVTIKAGDATYNVPKSSILRVMEATAADKTEVLNYLKEAYSAGNNPEYEAMIEQIFRSI